MTSVAQLLKSKPNQGVFTVAADDSVYDAIKLMADKQIGALVVTEGEMFRAAVAHAKNVGREGPVPGRKRGDRVENDAFAVMLTVCDRRNVRRGHGVRQRH